MRGFLVFLVILASCGSTPEPPRRTENPPASPSSPANVVKDDRPVVLCFGDSLTAGFGVAPGHGYPELLQKALDEKGYRYRVVNAGINGDTTSGGLSRLQQAVELKPSVVLLELGGNDGLRGLPIEATRANLEELIAGFQKAGATVLLAGMTLPRNYGPEYIGQFEGLYKDLAKNYKVTLVPFLLEPMVAKPGLMQPDGIHPTAEGYRTVVPWFVKYLERVLKKD